VSATQAQQQQDGVLELRGRLEEHERERIGLEGDLQALRLERASNALEAETRRAALERQMAELDQQITEQESGRNTVITAPADGVVTALLVQPGQQVKAGAPLLSIIPAGARMVAKLLVPSHAIGFVAPQQSVALRYEAFPYQRFGHQHGHIESVSKTLVLPGDANLPVELREPAYLVTVQLEKQTIMAYGKSLALQVGMSLDGDVHLDRRSLLQWVLDPIYSVMKSV
jgi:membrane fusion protein